MQATEICLTDSHYKQTRSERPVVGSTIPDCIKYYAETKAHAEAIVFVSAGFSREVVTWTELYKNSRRLAQALVCLGLKQDEVVAVNIRNCPQWLYFTFGAMMAGAIPVSVSFTYKDGSDLVAVMERLAKCSMLVMDPGLEGANWNVIKNLVNIQNDNGGASSPKMPYLRYLLAYEQGEDNEMQGILHTEALINKEFHDVHLPSISESDIACLFQTSGSTGVPKLVAHTHRGLCLSQQLAIESIGMNNVSIFNDRPFAWIGGFPLTVMSGITRVTLNGFSPAIPDKGAFLIELAKREKCVAISALPQMIYELIRRQDELTYDWNVVLVTGGQPLSQPIAQCIGKVAPALMTAYGGTEFQAVSAAYFAAEEQFEPNYVGSPYKGIELEIKVVDENLKVVPLNTSGNILVKGDGVFKCYFNDPELTDQVKSTDGWYRTDDIGRLTEKGILYVEGRNSSVIISGGMNVSPDHLERIIETFPGIEAAVVVPVKDDVYYQTLCACLRVKPGYDVNADKLRIFLEEYHNDKPGLFTVLPKHFLFLEEFPELYTGKVARMSLESIANDRYGKTKNN